MEGNASVYQVYPACRITGEGRAEFLRAWGHGFEQEGAGGRGEWAGQLKMCVETTNPSGNKYDGFGRNAPVYYVCPVSRTTSEERAECVGGGGKVFFDKI